MPRFAIVAICAALLTGCDREQRNLRPSPTRLAIYGGAAVESTLHPGGTPAPRVVNPSNGNAYDISEGQRLFNWYNCSGCHANGGGGIGPPLIKKEWIYGNEDANLFDTIVKGRPNGMPTWGSRIPEYQIWQIVAYVRSMNQEQPQAATAKRLDTLEPSPQTLRYPPTGAPR
jgi:cytochrome c oxidase cbb3-type subunit III